MVTIGSVARTGAIGDSRLDPQAERKNKENERWWEDFGFRPGVMVHACKSSQNSRPTSSPTKDLHVPVHMGSFKKKEYFQFN